MSTFAYNFNLHSEVGSEERSFAYSDITFIEVWNIMESIHFINRVEASLLNHSSRTTISFFSWLEQESNFLILWDLTSVFLDY